MLSKAPGKKLNIFTDSYVVFDLETTGISTARDRVIEIAAIKVENKQITGEFSTLVDPGIHIPSAASMVNNITDDMVRSAPEFRDVLDKFSEFAGELMLVGHNIASFDMKFICRDAIDYYGLTFGNDYSDTLYLSRALLPQLRHHTLIDLAGHYGIGTGGAHRALQDCKMNRLIYERLSEEQHRENCAAPACPKCGSVLKKRSGRFGEFWGCSSYPECTFTRNIK